MPANDRPFRGAIATPHVLATRAGEAAYRAGGSAIDATLAAAAVLTVVYPHNTSIGGDSFSLIRTPEGTTRCINATGYAGVAVDAGALRRRHGRQLPPIGIDTVTVPGAVRGWQRLHELGACREWEANLGDAIRYAHEGAPVAWSLAGAIRASEEHLRADRGAASVFFDGEGRKPEIGDILRQPALAESLRGLASRGADDFYSGAIATRLITGLRSLGSALDAADFAAYAARDENPIRVDFAGRTVLTSPPNTQGFLLVRYLRHLSAAGLEHPELGAAAGDLARSFHAGNRLRDTLLADPEFARVDLARLIAEQPNPAGVDEAGPAGLIPKGDTVGIAAVDSEGWAVSHIQSVYHHFGAAILEPETGILLQNRGTSFSLDDDSDNVIAPRKRPSHTLMPVLVERDDRLIGVNACMGGKAQAQIHTQLLLRQVAGVDAQQTVGGPRFVVGAVTPADTADSVHAEENLTGAVLRGLRETGFSVRVVPRYSEMLGQANVVQIADDGSFDAASDPRSDGSAAVVERRE